MKIPSLFFRRRPAAKTSRPCIIEPLEGRIAPAAALGATKVAFFAAGGDVNGDGKFQPGDTILYTVTITNNGDVDLTGVTFNDIIDPNTNLGAVNVGPLALNDTFTAVANTLLEVGVTHGSSPAAQVAGSVVGNDVEFLGDTFTFSKLQAVNFSGGTATATSGQGGTVTMDAAGHFSYLPAAGFTGADTFTYTITDKGLNGVAGDADDLTSTGTVSIAVGTQKVWYVDNSYTGANGASDGRSTRPFTSFTATNLNGPGGVGDVDGANDILFVHNGNSQSTAYGGGIGLEAGQTLQGEGTALIVGGFNLVAAGTLPKIGNPGGTAVNLSTDNKLRGFQATGAATAISGSSFNTLDVLNVTINNSTGAGLILTTGAFVSGSAFNSITSTGGGNSIALSGITGTGLIDLGGGALSGASGAEFAVVGGSAQLLYSGTITNTAGRSVDISTHATGNITLSGDLNDTGTGVSITNNTSGTIAFTGTTKTINTGANTAVTYTGNGASFQFIGGGLDIDTTTGTGINATGNTGAFNVTGTGNSINSVSATALTVSNTVIGALGLTFQRIDAGNNTAAADPASGIVLNNTGASGGLSVTGDGVNATLGGNGSGGTIQNTTGAAVSLTSTKNVNLNYLNITNPGTDGINAQSIDGFTYNRGTLSDSSGVAADEGLEFGDFTTGTSVNGTINITNSIIGPASGSAPHNNVAVGISGGASTWNVTGNKFQNNNNADFNVEVRNTTNATMTISGNTFAGNASTSAEGVHMQTAGAGLATLNATIQNNSFSNQNISIDVNADMSAHTIYKILTNTIVNDVRNDKPGTGAQTSSHAINAFMATTSLSGALMDLTIQGNIIGSSAIAGSGSSIGNGMRVNLNGNGVNHVLIDNNTIREAPLGRGIEVIGRNGTGSADVTIINNNVDHRNLAFDTTNGSNFPLAAILVQVNQVGTAGYTIRSNVHDNTVPSGSASDLGVGFLHLQQTQQTGTTTLQLIDNPPGSANAAAELASHNTGSTSTGGTIGLIAGPINLPPLFFAPSPDDVVVPPPVVIVTPPSLDGGSTPAVTPPVVQPPVIVDDGILSQAELDSLVGAAIARWEKTGLTPAQDALLHNVTFGVRDLPGWYLGEASAGHITLDSNAAGNSWFIDATPGDDGEFAGSQATATGGAAGRIDALTTVMHELGHQLGLDDRYAGADSGNLMYGYIHQSERRLPAVHQAEGATPHLVQGELDFAVGPINIGSLPIGKSVRIDFTAQIVANPSASTVSNQGTASSTQTGPVQTDDPNVAGTANPTVTQIALPEVNLAIGSTTSVAEDSGGNLVYTFTRQAPLTNSLTVNFNVSGGAVFTGNAASDTDYTQSGAATFTGTTGTVTFAPNSNTATVTVTPHADTTTELDETVVLTLASGSGYSVAATGSTSGSGTIANDDTTVFVSGTPGSVAEDSGSTLTYTFKRNGLIANAMDVHLHVAGSATFTADYGQSGATTYNSTDAFLHFNAGSDTATIVLTPTPDSTVEADETVQMTIVAGAGYNVDPLLNSLTGTITNDDATVSVAITAPGTIAEDAAGVLTYTFTRTGFIANAATVNFTASGSATKDVDYGVNGASFIGLAGTVTFAPNSNTATVTVDPTADANGEPDENVVFTINAGTGYSPATSPDEHATGTILNDDTSVSVAVTGSPISEAATGGAHLTYTFTRSGDNSTPLTINFSAGGSASFANDYALTGATTFSSGTGLGTVTFAANSSMASVTVTPTNDTLVEGDEQAAIFVNTGPGYGVGASPAIGSLTDNETATVSFVAATSSTPEGTTPHLVGVKLVTFSPEGTASLQNDFTVYVQDTTVPGVGVATGSGIDYTFNEQSVLFSAGDTGSSKTVSSAIANDNISEGNETFRLGLSPISNFRVAPDQAGSSAGTTDGFAVATVVAIDPNPHTVTIVDNDIDVHVTASSPVGNIVAGSGTGNVSFNFTVQNTGLTDATNLNLTELFNLPAGVTFSSSAPSGDTTFDGTNWFVPALAVNGTATLTVNLTADHSTASGANVATNLTADSADQDLVNVGDDFAAGSASITRQSDLQLSLTDTPDPVGPNAQLTYTITVHNAGPSDVAGASVTDLLPAGFSSATWTTSVNGTAGTGGSGDVHATADIPFNGDLVVTVIGTVTAASNTSISNTASVSSSEEINLTDNDDSETTFVGGVDLTLAKAGDAATLAPGGVIKYTLTYRNGGFITANGVNITDTIPANTVFDLANSSAGWQTSGGTTLADGAAAGTAIKFPLGSLPVSMTGGTVILAVKVTPTVAAGASTVDNAADIADNGAAGADLTPSDNHATASSTLDAAPDLAVTSKSDGITVVVAGATHTYTINYANVGKQGATGVFIEDVVPVGMTFNQAENPQWAPTATPNVYRHTVAGEFAAGATDSVPIILHVDAPLQNGLISLTNTATIKDDDANGADPSGNDSASDTDVNSIPVTLVNVHTARFTDVDGDLVTVRVNRGTLEQSDFLLVPSGAGGQLMLVDFSDDGTEFQNTNLVISAVKKPGGDGKVNVGHIDAHGIDLSVVRLSGDLGQIDVGNADPLTSGLRNLAVGSLGTRTDTQPGGTTEPLHSEITGRLEVLVVKGNFGGVLDVTGGAHGRIGPVTIFGNLDGSAGGSEAGLIRSTGNIGAVTAGGISGGADHTGIVSGGTLGQVLVRHDFASPDATKPVVISALGTPGVTTQNHATAIAGVHVLGNVANARILAGHNLVAGVFVGSNSDAAIGAIIVGGGWNASSVAAGVADTTADGFGRNDVLIPGGSAAVIAKIASITIKDPAQGSTAAGDFYGITAERIVSARLNGKAIALTPHPANVEIDTTNHDFRLVELS